MFSTAPVAVPTPYPTPRTSCARAINSEAASDGRSDAKATADWEHYVSLIKCLPSQNIQDCSAHGTLRAVDSPLPPA